MISRHHRSLSSRCVALDAELHLLDVGAGLLERLHRLGDHRGDARVDREDVEVGL